MDIAQVHLEEQEIQSESVEVSSCLVLSFASGVGSCKVDTSGSRRHVACSTAVIVKVRILTGSQASTRFFFKMD